MNQAFAPSAGHFVDFYTAMATNQSNRLLNLPGELQTAIYKLIMPRRRIVLFLQEPDLDRYRPGHLQWLSRMMGPPSSRRGRLRRLCSVFIWYTFGAGSRAQFLRVIRLFPTCKAMYLALKPMIWDLVTVVLYADWTLAMQFWTVREKIASRNYPLRYLDIRKASARFIRKELKRLIMCFRQLKMVTILPDCKTWHMLLAIVEIGKQCGLSNAYVM
ncbi:uncharacterized protein AB675_11835 [Cyphellophora attinorum]|uniref:Uncharacterized protein n=1 Tax=Cyphellophora attinorum TaxID=1664694 RepID=A0A0N1GZQ4_9EURO|nr:uncharacterized protein AB675_11835 [Phialophora attinorum]KPI36777.1 hypothetical protein AB675_11835 [Phialophora attinorum]